MRRSLNLIVKKQLKILNGELHKICAFLTEIGSIILFPTIINNVYFSANWSNNRIKLAHKLSTIPGFLFIFLVPAKQLQFFNLNL
jgi:hypothetical protein